MDTDKEKWLSKIEALMRKAEDPATSEVEREGIMDKVMYLMTKFNIEQSMLNFEAEKPVVAIHRKVVIGNPYPNQKASLLNSVARMFDCYLVHTRDGKVSIFGTIDDIESTLLLYYSLVMQMMTEKDKAFRTKPSWEHGRTFNTSFVVAYISTIHRRILEIIRRVKTDIKQTTTGNGMELVLVNKQQVVKNMMNDTFGQLRVSRTSFANNSRAGESAGRSAGQRADLGGTRIAGGRKAIGN